MVYCLLILACLFRTASTISEVADSASNRVCNSSTLGNTAVSSAKALHGATPISTTISDPYSYVFGITQEVSLNQQGMTEASTTASGLEVHHPSHNEFPRADMEIDALLLSSGRRLFSGGPGPVIIYGGQPTPTPLHTQTFETIIIFTAESSAITQMPSTSSTMDQSVSIQASLTPTNTAQSVSMRMPSTTATVVSLDSTKAITPETSFQTPSSTNTSLTTPPTIVEDKSHSQRQVIAGATSAALVLSGSIVSVLLLRHLRQRRRRTNASAILIPYAMTQEQQRSLHPQSLGVHSNNATVYTSENDERSRSDNMQWLALIAASIPGQNSMDERTNNSSAGKQLMVTSNQPRDPEQRSRNSSGTSAATPPPSYRSEPDS